MGYIVALIKINVYYNKFKRTIVARPIQTISTKRQYTYRYLYDNY